MHKRCVVIYFERSEGVSLRNIRRVKNQKTSFIDSIRTTGFRCVAIVIIMSMLTTCALTNLYAKYVVSGGVKVNSDVMSYITGSTNIRFFSGVNEGHLQNISTSKSNGTAYLQDAYTVIVSNKNENGEISGVDLSYSIKLNTTGNLPMNYTLHYSRNEGSGKGSGEKYIVSGTDTITFNSSNSTEYVFEGGTLPANTEQYHVYYFTVSWADTSSKYSDTPEMVQVTVDLKQTVRN